MCLCVLVEFVKVFYAMRMRPEDWQTHESRTLEVGGREVGRGRLVLSTKSGQTFVLDRQQNPSICQSQCLPICPSVRWSIPPSGGFLLCRSRLTFSWSIPSITIAQASPNIYISLPPNLHIFLFFFPLFSGSKVICRGGGTFYFLMDLKPTPYL